MKCQEKHLVDTKAGPSESERNSLSAKPTERED